MPSPPSATGSSSASWPAERSPRAIAAATSDAANVPLKESGATSAGRTSMERAYPLAPVSETIDKLLEANERYAAEFDLEQGMLPAPPRRGLAIISCMDARIRVHTMLGLTEGDAHVIRNAGGVVTDDAIRSLAISQRRLETRRVMVIQHTRCGMNGLDEDELRDELRRDAGEDPAWPIGAFPDLEQSVRDSLEQLRSSPYLPHRDAIRGFIYDVESGRLREVLA